MGNMLGDILGDDMGERIGEKVGEKKSRIRETKHLSIDADNSTDTTVGWTKNNQKPNFFEKRKIHPKCKNSKTSRDMPILVIYPSTRGL